MSEQFSGRRTVWDYLEVAIIALAMSAAVAFGYDHFYAQKIRVLDLKAYLRTQKALLTSNEISEEQWRAGLDKVEETLNSEPANHVVVLKDVVLRNGDEIDLR
ncbi:MAG: hypothetical protein ACYC9M_11620 [Desulfobulbaceae bacterium]